MNGLLDTVGSMCGQWWIFPIFELLHHGSKKWTQLWWSNIWFCICCQANLLVLPNSRRVDFLKKEKQRDSQSPPTDEQVGCVGSKYVPRICFIHHGGTIQDTWRQLSIVEPSTLACSTSCVCLSNRVKIVSGTFWLLDEGRGDQSQFLLLLELTGEQA